MLQLDCTVTYISVESILSFYVAEIIVQNESWGCTKLGKDKLKSIVLDGDGSQEYRLGIIALVVSPTNH